MSSRFRTSLVVLTAASTMTAGGLAALAPAPASASTSLGVLAYGLAGTELEPRLVDFRVQRPETDRGDIDDVGGFPITGVKPFQRLVGIDVRPSTGVLYALAVRADGPPTADSIYTLDVATGAATLATDLQANLQGSAFGTDFDPVTDKLRVVGDTGQNWRIDVGTGAATSPGPLRYTDEPGRTPNLRGLAITHNVAGALEAHPYGYDVGTPGNGFDSLAHLEHKPADDGTMTVSQSGPAGFDVPEDSNVVGLDVEAGTGTGVAVLSNGSATPTVFTFDPGFVPSTTFQAVGQLYDPTVRDLAIASPRVGAGDDVSVVEGGTGTFSVRRLGDDRDALTVTYSVTGGTASEADYTAPSGTVTIPAKQQSATVTIPTTQDGAVENDETVVVTLDAARSDALLVNNASLLADKSVTLTIRNDDAPPAPAPPVVTPSPTPSATPSPTVPPSPTASPTPSATATVSPTPATPLAPLSLSVAEETIVPTETGVLTARGAANRNVELLAYSQPDTTYAVVRRAPLGADGTVQFRILPGANTRLYVRYAGVEGADSPSVVQQVATSLSLGAVRNGSLDYTFSGRVLPRRAGQLITLYRIDEVRGEVITSQVRTDRTGTWRVRRTFTGRASSTSSPAPATT